MISLFIDTHDKNIIEVLYKDNKILDKEIIVSERHHSDYTMPMLETLLKRNNLNVHDINEILVINGPGSFTGVRIGVTIAKTLAYTLEIPIKTMTSLEAMAISKITSEKKLSIIKDIKGVFGCLYNYDNKELTEPFYKSNAEFETYIKENNLESNIILEESYNYELIYKEFCKKNNTNPHNVNPIYIKIIEALKND